MSDQEQLRISSHNEIFISERYALRILESMVRQEGVKDGQNYKGDFSKTALAVGAQGLLGLYELNKNKDFGTSGTWTEGYYKGINQGHKNAIVSYARHIITWIKEAGFKIPEEFPKELEMET